MIGIGTGFSTTIPQFNPIDCCNNIRRKLDGLPYLSMMPYYKGFKGKIAKVKGIQKFITKGKYTIDDDKVIITELPIGKWTHDFKEFIEENIQKEDSWILDYENHSTDEKVKFVIKVSDEKLFDNQYKKGDVFEHLFKLTSNKSVSNLHLYNRTGTIRKYDTIYQIIDEHYYTRFDMYVKRKDYELENLKNEIKLLESKMRFIQDVINETVVINKQSKASIIEKLRELEYPFYENSQIDDYDEEIEVKNQYNYLLNLSIYNFTSEKLDELENDINDRKKKYDDLEKMEIKDIWKNELDIFEEKYNEWLKSKN